MAHANARTNLFARRLMVQRVAAGWSAAHVAEQLGVSRETVYKWLRRHAEAGDAGPQVVEVPHQGVSSHRVLQRSVKLVPAIDATAQLLQNEG